MDGESPRSGVAAPEGRRFAASLTRVDLRTPCGCGDDLDELVRTRAIARVLARMLFEEARRDAPRPIQPPEHESP